MRFYRLVAPERYLTIAQALEDVGDDLLKPVREHLGDAYSYEEIRLVRAWERLARSG